MSQQITNHLTDGQLAGWLAGEADRETASHLESCPQCSVEALQLRDGISRYSIAMRRQAAHAQEVHANANFAPGKASALHRIRWAGAGVLALLLAAQTAWLLKPRPTPPTAGSQPTSSQPARRLATQSAAQSATQSATQPATQLATQPETQMSDDELLEAVNNDLSREVPLALAPVSAITTARNRMAAASGNASGR